MAKSNEPIEEKITRDDLVAKFAAVKGQADESANESLDKSLPLLAAGGVLVLILAFIIGKRVGKKKSTVVEIRRI